MKLQKYILTILIFLFAVTTNAQMAQSDYEIQKEFKKSYTQYISKLEQISSSDSAKALIEDIREFDKKYNQHSELLNKALYPVTYEQKLEELKKSSVVALNRIEKIEQQAQRMQNLQDQVAGYEQNIGYLNHRTDSLQQAMQNSIASEKRLSDMLRTYRNNLEKRDELILAFIDSMVVVYQQMDLKTVQDLEDIDNKSRLESNGDALDVIHKISVENLDILKNNTNNLHLEDYLRMSEVQREFQEMWVRLGGKIQDVYAGEDVETLASEIEENITEWKQILTTRTFAALEDSLAEQGINIGKFKNGEELYTSLNSYLDAKIVQSEEKATRANYDDFSRFKEFWNKAEIQWSSNLVDAGILTNTQMVTLNKKVDTWNDFARPAETNILVYLLGASVLLAVALGVMLIREKKNKGHA